MQKYANALSQIVKAISQLHYYFMLFYIPVHKEQIFLVLITTL